MKRQTIIVLLAIIAILAVVIFTGCLEKEAPETTMSTQTPTPTPTTTPTPEQTLSVERPTTIFENSGV
jgi:ABC-type uncharacterized transport system auxiliary subunit